MTKVPYSRRDYFEAILVGILITILIVSFYFLLFHSILSGQVLLASFFGGVLVGGLLVRLRRKHPAEKPVEPSMVRGSYVLMATFTTLIVVLLLLIVLFRTSPLLSLLSLATVPGMNLGVFFLVLRRHGTSSMIIQGARRAILLFATGGEVLFFVIVLFQRLPYIDPMTELAAMIWMGSIAILTYFVGKSATP